MSALYDRTTSTTVAPVSVKIVISGGFGVGKTTFVGSISEIEPLLTEADMTDESVGVDNRDPVPGKVTTTVALDFGRISLDETLRLYLFGTPGQDRYAFLWDDLVEGALGAVVLLDTQRIEDCFPAIDYFEEHRVPFLVAVNHFQDTRQFELAEVREALGVDDLVPLVPCDARRRDSVKGVLVALTEEVLARRLAEQAAVF
ncbi:GTP-binding protein [Kineosporia babensis]|uniref:ATP/GTP-binding protein n=1 Tax=Kineosporia babensis TaxID=499548 RepID=A0A9X1NC27_9ACTN|nr:ATP/GTP-binding protein [Kineosporia babensis]